MDVEQGIKKYNRREFLFLTTATAITLAAGLLPGAPEEIQEKVDRVSPVLGRKNGRVSLTDTFGDTIKYNFMQVIGCRISQELKLPVGNASLEPVRKGFLKGYQEGLTLEDEKLLENRTFQKASILSLLLKVFFTSPVLEESLFRLLPNVIAQDHSNDPRWDVGLGTSLAFALFHNLTRDESEHLRFDRSKIPLFQGISGIYLWKLVRERGFMHSVVSHITINISTFPIAIILAMASTLGMVIKDKFFDG